MDLQRIAREIREFEGVTRKKPIAEIINVFESVRCEYSNSVVDFGDDAAVVDIGGDDYILFAADGIWARLINASMWWAGYSSVLVNVNDIAAMGGKPVAMVNVLSSANKEACKELLGGIRDGIAKFGVPMVGGHMHPDTPYTSLSVAIIGTVKKGCEIRSSTARVGDTIIAAYDMDGRVGPNSPYSFDSTTMKEAEEVRRRYRVMQILGERGLVTSGKDISNPGLIGTLGMLIETSHVGARVDLTEIPAPAGIDFIQWLKIHPAIGFVVTSLPEDESEVISLFENAGYRAAGIGSIEDTSRLDICCDGESTAVFDFDIDIVTGINQ
ncbi:putative methanogenesis marker protein 2 [Candidatus Methanoperedens nitroreducens]|uniref:Putative methanogenesis marker protein 2 n=1 Tax=Candidatus Methanoperedens nitratireducens TaxID=1392998 RepID=A0A062V6J2_9EURY|nr:methanogenesis marker 2 protein [Candidatus Methanoperedens nitroreducens]KCZ70995.1 putative methanogenesis marker protein 2 [Candidatus Methanoperedens nitroreducens]MDJ1421635.1 methanogenesis marker 2 protein [Candidatus Methanoperedens sp.]